MYQRYLLHTPCRDHPNFRKIHAILLFSRLSKPDIRNNPMPRNTGVSDEKRMVLKQLAAAAPDIRKRFGVKRIGIFGSFARGDQTMKSDVDVLVELADGYSTLRNFVGLADFLEELFRRKVDLLTIEGIDRYIRHRVEAEVIWI